MSRPGAPKTRSKAENRRRAYHEAGHAIVMHALDRLVGAVSIEGDGFPTECFVSETAIDDFDGEAVALVAGHITERIAAGKTVAQRLFCSLAAFRARSPDAVAAVTLAASAVESSDRVVSLLDEVSRYDHAAVRAANYYVYATERGSRPRHAFLDRAFSRSEEILRERWPAVEALAAALLEHRELNGERAHATIEAALAPPTA